MRISDWSSDVCSSDLAEQSLQCGKRRLGAHLPALALDAVEQRGFLSAHISASADAHLQRERRDAVGRQPDGRLHRIYRKGIFAADVDIAMRRADGMGRDRHPLDQAERIAFHQHAIRKGARSEEHTSELQSLMRNSYAVFCLK